VLSQLKALDHPNTSKAVEMETFRWAVLTLVQAVVKALHPLNIINQVETSRWAVPKRDLTGNGMEL
jgi:hypothetical protein